MPLFLIPAITWIKANRLTTWLLVIIAALVLGVFGYFSIKQRGVKEEKARQAVAVVEAVKAGSSANVKSAEQSIKDAEKIAQTREELVNEVAKVPDTVPDAVAVRLGCLRLRNAGNDVSKLPACGGLVTP